MQKDRSTRLKGPSKGIYVVLALTGLWVIAAVLSYLLQSARVGGHPPFPVWLHYRYLIATAVIPAGAWWLAFRRRGQRRAADEMIEGLQALPPDHFTEWIASRLREQGYSTKHASDHGHQNVDIIAEAAPDVVVVQCKHYQAQAIDESVLQDLIETMRDLGGTRACIVTTGHLTAAARDWVDGKPIEIWDGTYLVKLVKRVLRQTVEPSVTATRRHKQPKPAIRGRQS